MVHVVVTIAEHACDYIVKRVLTLFRLGYFGTIRLVGGHIVPPSVSPLFVIQLPLHLAC